MNAFVALMLVAAVSGQISTGVDRNLFDMIRNRHLYGQYGRGVSGLKTDVTGLYGDVTTGYLPSTQQYNIPSDVTLYTLRQLFTLPVFQEYLSLPLFKQYLTVPAFQRYLVSQYFQQYFTQTIFRQFFVDPVLFYKYIYPVVLQYNTGVTGVEQTLVVPEIYRHLVPEIYRRTVVPEVYSGVVPTTYSGIVPETFGNGYTTEEILRKLVEGKQIYGNGFTTEELLRKIVEGKQIYGNGFNTEELLRKIVEGKQVYGNAYVDELLRKIVLGQIYGTGVTGGFYGNNFDLLRKILLGNVYGTGINGGIYGNNYDLLRKILLGNVYGTGLNGGFYGNRFGQTYNTNKYFGGVEGNTFTGIHKVAPVVFDSLFKDLLDGKVTIEEIKGFETTGMLGDKLAEKYNKIVDPITGDIKIVSEKVVKPVETLIEGENVNDVLLNKMLKKTTFNKL